MYDEIGAGSSELLGKLEKKQPGRRIFVGQSVPSCAIRQRERERGRERKIYT